MNTEIALKSYVRVLLVGIDKISIPLMKENELEALGMKVKYRVKIWSYNMN